MLAGDSDHQDLKRLPREDEAVVLRTLLETFISRAWCLRQPCDGSSMLTFPNVVRLRHYCCGNKKCKDFEKPFKDREAIVEALAPDGEGRVFCSRCGKPIHLRDVIEEKCTSAGVQIEVRMMEKQAKAAIDNESRELILVGHAFSIR